MDDRMQQLIDRLVEKHGERGLSPTRQDWCAILSRPADQPVDMLNLLRFKPQARSEDAVTSGFSAYGRYSTRVATAFARVGGKVLYFGRAHHSFGTSAGEAWDAAILTRYPTPQALANFWLDEEFVLAHSHREAGVLESRVLVLAAFTDDSRTIRVHAVETTR